MKVESKTGTVKFKDQVIFNFISDFNNFKNLVPADKIKNWESTPEGCSFEFEGLGKSGMKIIEKEPYKLIKIGSANDSKFEFYLWIQLKEVNNNETKIRITIEPSVNPMLAMMVKGPLQQFVDSLVDRMSGFNFDETIVK